MDSRTIRPHGIPKTLWRDLTEAAQCALHLEAANDERRAHYGEAWAKGEEAWKPGQRSRLAADPATDPATDPKRYGERAYALALGWPESVHAPGGSPYPWATVYQFVAAQRETLDRLEREEAARIAALPPLRRIWVWPMDGGTPPDDALEARATERRANLDRAHERFAERRREELATEAEAEAERREASRAIIQAKREELAAARRDQKEAAAQDREDRDQRIRQRYQDGETQAKIGSAYGLSSGPELRRSSGGSDRGSASVTVLARALVTVLATDRTGPMGTREVTAC